jgi:hypothetical protein
MSDIKYVFPGEKPPQDAKKVVYLSNVFFMMFIGIFGAISVLALILVSNYPTLSNKSALQQVGHFWNLLLGYIFPPLQSTGFKYFLTLIHNGQGTYADMLVYRGVGAIVLGLVAGIWLGLKSMTPINYIKHVRGKQLVKGKEAFDELSGLLKGKEVKGSGLMLAVRKPNVFKPVVKDEKTKAYVYTHIEDLKPNTYIELPEDKRRSHFVISGGTGRGKTQFILWSQIYQGYNEIASGKRTKMMICDTPKSDYGNILSNNRVLKVAPHEKDSVIWNIAKDLNNYDLGKAYWQGKIPVSDKEPIWGNSAIAIASGCTRLLQEICPEHWNFGMLSYLLSKPATYMKTKVPNLSPETYQIFDGAEQTLGSMMQNLGAFSNDLIGLARAWDGYDKKKVVFQATAKALSFPKFIKHIADEMSVENIHKIFDKDQIDELKNFCLNAGNKYSSVADIENTKTLFTMVCSYLNHTSKEQWKWEDFSKFVKQPVNKQKEILTDYTNNENEKEILKHITVAPFYWTFICSKVVFYADEWDTIEEKEKLSIKEWLLSANPNKKILLLKPSQETPDLTTGLIKGILYFTNSIILSDRFGDDQNRKFLMLIDEFQSYGKIDFFVKRALELYRSRGVSLTVAFQDLSQVDDIYDKNFVPFITANVGNIFLLGSNAGDTAERLSNLVGKRTINKLHRSKTVSDGGVSTSEDWQEHEEVVMSPDQFNTELGTNLKTKTIRYLYLGNMLPNAYILEMPLVSYPKKSKIDFIDMSNYTEPVIPTITNYWNKDKNDWLIKKEVTE